MLPSKRVKLSGLESQIGQENDAAQQETTCRVEGVQEDEPEHDICATNDEAFLAELRMTCSDSEDSLEASTDGGSVSRASHTSERTESTAMPSAVRLQNGSTIKNSTADALINMFELLSQQIAAIHNKTDSVQKQVAHISDRLGRVEKKVGISMATLEQVKDVVVITEEAMANSLRQKIPTVAKTVSSSTVTKNGATVGQMKNVGVTTGETLKHPITQEIQTTKKALGNSLATLELMKNVIVVTDETLLNLQKREIQSSVNSSKHHLNLKRISNEEDFTEFDTKLGNNGEFYASIKKQLTTHIQSNEKCKRMQEAMDLIFDQTFLPMCSWTGQGTTEPKITFKARTNILKLFADIGSNNCHTVDDYYIQDFFIKKLRNAQSRVVVQGISKAVFYK